jgi:hypothetical protein
MQYQMELSTPVGYLRVTATNQAVTHITFYDEPLVPNSAMENTITQIAIEQIHA